MTPIFKAFYNQVKGCQKIGMVGFYHVFITDSTPREIIKMAARSIARRFPKARFVVHENLGTKTSAPRSLEDIGSINKLQGYISIIDGEDAVDISYTYGNDVEFYGILMICDN